MPKAHHSGALIAHDTVPELAWPLLAWLAGPRRAE
jgi:hypothetical protein